MTSPWFQGTKGNCFLFFVFFFFSFLFNTKLGCAMIKAENSLFKSYSKLNYAPPLTQWFLRPHSGSLNLWLWWSSWRSSNLVSRVIYFNLKRFIDASEQLYYRVIKVFFFSFSPVFAVWLMWEKFCTNARFSFVWFYSAFTVNAVRFANIYTVVISHLGFAEINVFQYTLSP